MIVVRRVSLDHRSGAGAGMQRAHTLHTAPQRSAPLVHEVDAALDSGGDTAAACLSPGGGTDDEPYLAHLREQR